MPDYTHTMKLNAPAGKVYDAIARPDGPGNWWSKFCTVDDHEGGKAEFQFPKAEFHAVMEIATLKPGLLVEWKCIDSKHPESTGFQNLRDWEGTRMRFEISRNDEKTSTLTFTHLGLNKKLECFDVCQQGWEYYLGSLKKFVETGTGTPYADAG